MTPSRLFLSVVVGLLTIAASPADTDVLATVGGLPITRKEIHCNRCGMTDDELLAGRVLREVVPVAMKRAGLTVDPAAVEERLQRALPEAALVQAANIDHDIARAALAVLDGETLAEAHHKFLAAHHLPEAALSEFLDKRPTKAMIEQFLATDVKESIRSTAADRIRLEISLEKLARFDRSLPAADQTRFWLSVMHDARVVMPKPDMALPDIRGALVYAQRNRSH